MHCLFYFKDSRNRQHPYPDINTDSFKASAEKAITLMKDADMVMRKITSSQSFSDDLMTAAQESDQSRVEELIKSVGIRIQPDISYSPDGITMNFKDHVGDQECCHIILQLRWV